MAALVCVVWSAEAVGQNRGGKKSVPFSDQAVSKAIEKTREAAKGDDVAAIKSAMEELEQASHALSKALYETAGPPPGAEPGAAGATPPPAAG